MSEVMELDTLVLGAGVVGMAVAREFARRGREVTLVEAEPGFGRHASSRNSEVIHGGFYYEPGSLKARHCRPGRELLYRYAEEHGIPHRRCGKVVVASDLNETPRLEALLERGKLNGVEDLRIIDRAELRKLEPAVEGALALHSPATGIIDSHELLQSLEREIEALGGMIVYRSPVIGAVLEEGRPILEIGGDEPALFSPALLVNAAGSGARAIAQRLRGASWETPEIRLVAGRYLAYAGPCPFERLVYPLPEADGLGVHATLDLAGALRFGPDTAPVARTGEELPLEQLHYAVPDDLAQQFARSIRRFWPDVEEARLHPDYAGIRTKTVMADGSAPDFIIAGPQDHGIGGLVHLLGIESPGLTAAFSLATAVVEMLQED